MLQNKDCLIAMIRSLTLREKVLTINVILYFCLGGGILYRAFFRHASWPAYLIGFAFLMMGGYRCYLIYRAFTKGNRGAEVAGR